MTILAVLAAVPAFTPLPAYDSLQYCQNIVQIGTVKEFDSVQTCLQKEQEAKEFVEQSLWHGATENARRMCKGLFSDPSGGSFSVLSFCLIESAVDDLRKVVENPAGKVDQVPPCADGRLECFPWERSWTSSDKVEPNDIVTADGSILRGPE